jgi:hypothetical protein
VLRSRWTNVDCRFGASRGLPRVVCPATQEAVTTAGLPRPGRNRVELGDHCRPFKPGGADRVRLHN